jgi:hypothetical protein
VARCVGDGGVSPSQLSLSPLSDLSRAYHHCRKTPQTSLPSLLIGGLVLDGRCQRDLYYFVLLGRTRTRRWGVPLNMLKIWLSD